MSKIDTSSWKEFKVSDIFICETTKGIPSKNDLIDGDIPYITRSSEHNGFTQTCGNTENIVKGNCITIGAEGFVAFYQKNDFVAGNKVYSLRIKHYKMNETLGLYLASALNSLSENYSFNNARILEKIKNEVIKLPAIETYEPDWQYMEEYMKNIESEVTSKIDKFQMILENEKHKTDTQKWGGCKIGDLFEIKISKSINKTDLNFTCDGKYDFIGRTSINNGVQGRMEQIKTPPNSKQTFSVAQIGENVCLYRDNEWYSSQNIFCLTPKYIELIQCNKFITSVITNQLKATFGLDAYSNYPTLKTLSELIIKLPTLDESPDWGYMEEYMKDIEYKVINYIDSVKYIQPTNAQ